MRIRAIGTGSARVKHPLIPTTYLIQLAESNLLIGCPPSISAKLESINMSLKDIDIWVVGDTRVAFSGGLEELSFLAQSTGKKPLVVATAAISGRLAAKYQDGVLGRSFGCFERRAVLSVGLRDDLYDDVLIIQQDLPWSCSYFLKNAGIAFCGLPELSKYLGLPSVRAVVLDIDGEPELAAEAIARHPTPLQQKIWLVGYGNDYQAMPEMVPALPLPQGSCLFDSGWKDRHMNKERFLREDAKRLAGNRAQE